MPQFDKWLTSVAADDPVGKVARRAIKARLQAVGHFLKRAERAGSRDLEPVHQLRVWTRRASAAIDLFRDLLPRRKARKAKRTLRRVRRLGGEARDSDLLLQSLAQETATPQSAALARRIQKRRKRAQRPIDRVKRKLINRGKLKRLRKKLVAEVRVRGERRKSPEPTFRLWAREQLRELIDRFLTFDAAQLQDDEQLHRLRIAGKRLRYAAELSVAAFPRIETSGVYDQLVQLQERLGDAVDHLAAIERIEQLLDKASDEERAYLEAALEEHRRKFAVKKKKLIRYWTIARRRTLESRWKGVLQCRQPERS